jgi:molybdopterin synthase catalytic subunit
MNFSILFTHAPIAVPSAPTGSKEIGAVVEFHGVVRELENGVALAGLHYEAYEPMAKRRLEAIFESLQSTAPVHSIQFIHRLGWVPVGEASLYIRVTAAHRGEAFEFCKETIDAMKRDVPIWKTVPPKNLLTPLTRLT